MISEYLAYLLLFYNFLKVLRSFLEVLHSFSVGVSKVGCQKLGALCEILLHKMDLTIFGYNETKFVYYFADFKVLMEISNNFIVDDV